MNASANQPPHEFNIIVNARPKKVSGPTVTFDQIVALTFDPVPSPDNFVVTVAYRKGGPKNTGTLAAGQSVEVVNGMIFDVTATNRS
jgi:hypothetical protein